MLDSPWGDGGYAEVVAEVAQERVEGKAVMEVMEVMEVTGLPWHPASWSLVVAGAGAGQQVEGQPGKLWCLQRKHHKQQQPLWPQQREIVSR